MDSAIVLVILRLLLIFLIFQKMNFLNVRQSARKPYIKSLLSHPPWRRLLFVLLEPQWKFGVTSLATQKLKSPFLTLFTYSGTIKYNQKFKILLIESKASHNRNPLSLNKFFKQKQNKFYLHKLLFRIQKILHLSLFLSQMNRLHFC
ncbi:hypothetical protein FAEPRAA2165_03349 [Faecalibacterium duncaniae]|uniref:Uncharacterized protein n=1 Tax=Faecalibacterium duncaniae (strain DSM 17677 / JCM 31915 / A2-165) TaxID=411483 RepID=C7HAN4_FAED2|nr:hypothetical protein FAEPRAA2165_03349 [Faecalibacterium duncaniae]